MGKEEQLQWERQWAPWAAVSSLLAALLPIVATVYASSLLGQIDSNREDLFLLKVHTHAGGYIASGVITAPGGRLELVGTGPKSRSVSNKTDQAGDA